MSDPIRLGLVGSTGMIGRAVMDAVIGRPQFQLVAIARREIQLPRGARMEMRLAPVEQWQEVLEHVKPASLICALGTTQQKARGDADAFRAVDLDLVINTARAARDAGVGHFIFVSSAGADSGSKNLYLRTKGEAERELARLKFRRLDILRPGLLRGKRMDDPRPLEKLAILTCPVWNPLLQGSSRKYRAIRAQTLALAALMCAREKAAGRFVHEYDALERLAKRLDG